MSILFYITSISATPTQPIKPFPLPSSLLSSLLSSPSPSPHLLVSLANDKANLNHASLISPQEPVFFEHRHLTQVEPDVFVAAVENVVIVLVEQVEILIEFVDN